MYPALTPLLILQDRDQKIFNAKEELNQIPIDAEKLKSRLSEQMNAVQEAKKAQMTIETQVKSLELDAETRRETIQKLKTRQADTKKNDEYQMLVHEIKRYTREVDELETDELRLMETLDEAKQKRASVSERFEQNKALVVEESKELVARKKALEEKLTQYASNRKELAGNVDQDVLTIYERIMSRRGIGAVSLVTETGQCLGCNIKLPAAAFYRVQAGEALIQCSECSRILYYA